MIAWLKATIGADFVSSGDAANSPGARAPSPAIELTVRNKEKRYDFLMQLLAQQARQGRRTHEPKLVAAVITHLGELSPHFIELIEKITIAAASAYRPGPLNSGAPRNKHTAMFRTRLKDALMACNARGFGRALRSAGNPLPGWVCTQVDELLHPTWGDVGY